MKPLLLAGWIVAFGGDIATTNVALQTGMTREVTLPTQRPLVINTILGAESIGGYIMYEKLKKTHPKWAKVLYVTTVAAHSAAAVWNYTQIREIRRNR